MIRAPILSHSKCPTKTPTLRVYHYLENTHVSLSRGIFPLCQWTCWQCSYFIYIFILQAAYNLWLGKIFAETLARVALALPCASCRSTGNPGSWTMGSGSQPSMFWPFHILVANRCVHTQHQLYFLSPNCLKPPKNFLLSKRIKMTASFSLSPTVWYLQNNSISTICKNPYNSGTLLFPAHTPDNIAPYANQGKHCYCFWALQGTAQINSGKGVVESVLWQHFWMQLSVLCSLCFFCVCHGWTPESPHVLAGESGWVTVQELCIHFGANWKNVLFCIFLFFFF